jgi:rhamnose utilization protein RhaD (predicted bifunctional aldolase and dehydrogenase)
MVDMYPLCTFKNNPVAASIDTPLHGFLPFPHVDHLHPDWGIALAAAANGLEKMAEFNQRYGHHLVWVPWQRPGFELGMMMKRRSRRIPAATESCSADMACLLGAIRTASLISTPLRSSISWASSSTNMWRARGCDLRRRPVQNPADHANFALEVLPYLRGQVSNNRRVIGTYSTCLRF